MTRRIGVGIGVVVIAGLACVLAWSAGCKGPGKPVGEGVCREFLRLKNAGDSRADELLGRVPSVPAEPVTPEAADALQTDYFLRCKLRITEVRPEPGKADRFALSTEGSAVAEKMAVQEAGGVKWVQRTVYNPTLVVEVRDGKIFGVRSEL